MRRYRTGGFCSTGQYFSRWVAPFQSSSLLGNNGSSGDEQPIWPLLGASYPQVGWPSLRPWWHAVICAAGKLLELGGLGDEGLHLSGGTLTVFFIAFQKVPHAHKIHCFLAKDGWASAHFRQMDGASGPLHLAGHLFHLASQTSTVWLHIVLLVTFRSRNQVKVQMWKEKKEEKSACSYYIFIHIFILFTYVFVSITCIWSRG